MARLHPVHDDEHPARPDVQGLHQPRGGAITIRKDSTVVLFPDISVRSQNIQQVLDQHRIYLSDHLRSPILVKYSSWFVQTSIAQIRIEVGFVPTKEPYDPRHLLTGPEIVEHTRCLG